MGERRKVERHRIVAEVDYRTGWKSDRAVAYDLSGDGCMLRASYGFVETGDTILIRFTDRISVEGKVIWHIRRNAGLQFLEPVSPLIISHLSCRDNKFELNSALGRDRFGRPLLNSGSDKSPKRAV